MRDPELMIKILEEMSKKSSGSILVIRCFDMSETEKARFHHVELLCDTGLISKESDQCFRITNDGYNFLAAINQDRTINFPKFMKFLGEGIEFAESVRRIIDFVNSTS